MKSLIKLFFTFILLGSTLTVLPVHADNEGQAEPISEESSEKTPEETPSEETPAEESPSEDIPSEPVGEAWSGEITDPILPKEESTSATTEGQSTSIPTASTKPQTKKSTKIEATKTSNNHKTPETTNTAEPSEAPEPSETPETPEISESSETSTKDADDSESSDFIFLPETSSPKNYQERTQKIALLSLISTAIVFFFVTSSVLATKAYFKNSKKLQIKPNHKSQKSSKSHKSKKSKNTKNTKKSQNLKKSKDTNPLLLPHSR